MSKAHLWAKLPIERLVNFQNPVLRREVRARFRLRRVGFLASLTRLSLLMGATAFWLAIVLRSPIRSAPRIWRDADQCFVCGGCVDNWRDGGARFHWRTRGGNVGRFALEFDDGLGSHASEVGFAVDFLRLLWSAAFGFTAILCGVVWQFGDSSACNAALHFGCGFEFVGD